MAEVHDDTVLVTGGGGFLGGFVVRRLLDRGTAVRILSRRPLPELEALGAEVAIGDLTDRAAVIAACGGCAGVIHAAATPGIHAPLRSFLGPNVHGTRHVIDGCLVHRVPTLVHVSSPSVVFDGRPHEGADESLPPLVRGLANYPHSKLLAERDALRADRVRNLRTVAVRPHLLWGPGDRHILPALVGAAQRGRVPAIGGADPLVSPTYVENAAAALIAVLDRLPGRPDLAGRAYFLNDLPAVRLYGFVRRVAAEAGLGEPVRRSLPAPAARLAGRAAEAAWRASGRTGEPPLTRFTVAQLSVPHWYGTAAIRRFGAWEEAPIERAWARTRPFLRALAGTDGATGGASPADGSPASP